ncbi:MAG TPA: ATP-binding protein [Anaerolineales bacterium]
MAREQFSQWADIFPDALALVTPDGIIEAGNRKFQSLLGKKSGAIRGQSLTEFFFTPSDEGIVSYLRQCGRSRQFTLGSLHLKAATEVGDAARFRSEGALFAQQSEGTSSVILLRLTPRSLANQFSALTHQIHDLNLEIKKRMAAEKELARQQNWLQVTLSSISDAVIATDTGGRIVFMNPTACALTGWTSADGIGQELETIFNIVNEESRLPVRNPVQRTLEEGVITGLANHTVLVSRSGVSVAIDDGAAPIRDEEGIIRGVVLVFHEVTEQRNLERSLREQTQRLLEENRRKDEYLAMLAHELRNPLAAVANAFEVLRRLPAIPAVGLNTCQIAEGQLRQLRKLIDDLLDVSRMTHGKITLEKTRSELSAIVAQALETMKPFLSSRMIQLDIDMCADALWVDADFVRLAQVIGNVLHNAGKYTSAGGRVTVRTAQDRSDALITIRDDGHGIPETLLPYIFDLFVQGDQSLSRTEGGLGIGLTLARSIVGLHNGSIQARSEGVGKGTEFTVRIPLADAPQEAASTVTEHVSTAPSSGLRILVVDDNPALVVTFATLLELSGHTLQTALNGDSALDQFASFEPDVVLLDVGLPGVDGFAVARALRQRDRSGKLRIVGISGYGQQEYQTIGKEAGFDAYLVKPVDYDELEHLLTAFRSNP